MSVAKVMFMKEKNVSFQFGMKNIGCDASWKELKTAVLTLATTSPLTIFSNLVPLQVFYRVSVYFLDATSQGHAVIAVVPVTRCTLHTAMSGRLVDILWQ